MNDCTCHGVLTSVRVLFTKIHDMYVFPICICQLPFIKSVCSKQNYSTGVIGQIACGFWQFFGFLTSKTPITPRRCLSYNGKVAEIVANRGPNMCQMWVDLTRRGLVRWDLLVWVAAFSPTLILIICTK